MGKGLHRQLIDKKILICEQFAYKYLLMYLVNESNLYLRIASRFNRRTKSREKSSRKGNRPTTDRPRQTIRKSEMAMQGMRCYSPLQTHFHLTHVLFP